MNSRQKGARGERQWRDVLRAAGYDARRGQQFCGSPESPDVVCESLPWAHFEVKLVERLNICEAMEQAIRDAKGVEGRAPSVEGKVPFVAHRRNHWPWLVTMEAGTFFRLLRGDFQPRMGADKTGLTEENKGNEGAAPGFQI
jgi:Holliday junction resolvase